MLKYLIILVMAFVAQQALALPDEDEVVRALEGTVDETLQIKRLESLINRGNLHAQLILSEFYFYGAGVNKDEKRGLQLLESAAERGHVESLLRLAGRYKSGDQVVQNSMKAVRLYGEASKRGSTSAEDSLGDMYARGDGVPKDPMKAINFYTSAANRGNLYSAESLCSLYYHGEAVVKSYAQAFRWCQRAVLNLTIDPKQIVSAQSALSRVASLLSSMYGDGHGVSADKARALMWRNIDIATSNDDWMRGFAGKIREGMESEMTNRQIELAQKLSFDCQFSGFKKCF